MSNPDCLTVYHRTCTLRPAHLGTRLGDESLMEAFKKVISVKINLPVPRLLVPLRVLAGVVQIPEAFVIPGWLSEMEKSRNPKTLGVTRFL